MQMFPMIFLLVNTKSLCSTYHCVISFSIELHLRILMFKRVQLNSIHFIVVIESEFNSIQEYQDDIIDFQFSYIQYQ